MIGLFVLLTLGLLLAWMGGVLAVHRTLTRPPRRTYASAVARGRAGDPGELSPPLHFESWTFQSRRLELPAWDILGQDPSGPIVVMSHGWGDSRIGALQRLPLLLGIASRVIAWDMPGHGDAPGTSTLGVDEVDDLLALLAHLREPTRPIVLFGWSLGAGVSIATAARIGAESRAVTPPATIAAVVAEAPYRLPLTPARNMLKAMRWPRLGLPGPALWLASRRAPALRDPPQFDRAVLARNLPCRLLILHPALDEVCPIDDARAIAAHAGTLAQLEEFEGAYHNDLWQNEHRLARGEAVVRVFLRKS